MILKINSTVIVNERGKLFIGKIVSSGIKLNKRTYDVMLENGREILYVPVDSLDKATYIDSKLSSKYINFNGNSTINIKNRGNFNILTNEKIHK